MRRPDPKNIGRRGARWQKTTRPAVFQRWGTDCWICGHPDAYEVDHLDLANHPYDVEYLRPAHGANAPCPVCTSPRTPGRGKACNQDRYWDEQAGQERGDAFRAPLSVDVDSL